MWSGLGTMGRNHVRVLRDLPGVELVGATDPDPRARHAARAISVTPDLDTLLALGIDMCVVASPTLTHADVGLRLADAEVHALIEKPLTSDPQSGRLLAKTFEERELIGAVGHIERYNPAVSALQARLAQGDLGSVFQVTTRGQGPFAQRIRDVGVVMDLATHDIDLAQWVTGYRYLTVTAFTAHPSGRTHEDLVTVSGRLGDGTVANHLVNWLSSMKERIITVTGERGCLTANTLSTELCFYRNGSVITSHTDGPRFHGASEGDQIRSAISKREALSAELEAFRDAILGKPAEIVTLWQGVDTLKVADAILVASKNCKAVTLETGELTVPNQAGDPARNHPTGGEMTGEVTVVGLGKIGLPLAVQIAGKGFRVRGVDRNPVVARVVAEGSPPFPGEPGLAERLRAAVEAEMLVTTSDTARAVAESDVVIVVVSLVTDPAGRPDYSAVDAATASVAAGLRAGTLVSYETTLPVHTTRQRLGPALAAGSGLSLGRNFTLCHSPERVSSGTVFADLRRYPKLVGGIDARSGKAAEAFYGSVLDFDVRSDLSRPNGMWDLGSAEAAGSPSWPRPRTAMSTLRWPTSLRRGDHAH